MTHSCPKCKVEICRDTNAAINILKRGMKELGIEWNNSTQGHWEPASEAESLRCGSASRKTFQEEGKHGEKTANTIDGQPDIASGLL